MRLVSAPRRAGRIPGRGAGGQDRGAGVGERREGVVLREPVAVVAEFVGAARELERLRDRLRRAVPRDDGRLVKDGKLHAATPFASLVRANARRLSEAMIATTPS